MIEVSDGDDAEGSVGSAPASPSQEANVPASDQAVNLNISMKVDPARKEAGMSDIAIRAWEKQRRIIIGRVSTLVSGRDCLADERHSGIQSCEPSKSWQRSLAGGQMRSCLCIEISLSMPQAWLPWRSVWATRSNSVGPLERSRRSCVPS